MGVAVGACCTSLLVPSSLSSFAALSGLGGGVPGVPVQNKGVQSPDRCRIAGPVTDYTLFQPLFPAGGIGKFRPSPRTQVGELVRHFAPPHGLVSFWAT